MKTIGQRIRKLRKAEGLTQAKVATSLGIRAPSVTQWESDTTSPSGKSLIALASLLKTTPDYILYGIHPEEEGASYSAAPPNVEKAIIPFFRDVPIVANVQAGPGNVALVDYDPDDMVTVRSFVQCSESSFALRVSGSSMTTLNGPYSFPEGTLIIADPEQRGDITDGIFIIAKENGIDSVTFKQLKYDGGRPYLNPLNPEFKKFFGEFRVMAKIVDYKLMELP